MRTLLVLLLGAACAPSALPPPETPTEAAPVADQTDGGIYVGDDAEPAPIAPSVILRGGVPHSSLIVAVSVSPDGLSALSRDQLGGLRLWRTLDGTTEPELVPVRNATTMSLAGGTIALQTGTITRILRRKAGGFDEVSFVEPALTTISVLPDGEHLVGLGADHTLRLFTRDGTEVARLEERDYRPVDLRVVTDGKSLVAFTKVTGARVKVTARRFLISPQGFTRAGGEVAFDVGINLIPEHIAVSPSGNRVAYLTSTSPGEVATLVFDGPPLPNVKVQVVGISTHRIGFVSEDVILVGNPHAYAPLYRVDVAAGKAARHLPGSTVTLQTGVAAFAAGRMVTPYAEMLQVVEGHETLFLGYAMTQPRSASLSPSGRRVLWSTPHGAWVDDLDGGERVKLVLKDAPSFAMFVDEDQVVTVDPWGAVRLLQWRTGKVTDEANGGPARYAFSGAGVLGLLSMQSQVVLFRVSRERGLEGPFMVPGEVVQRGGILPSGKGMWLATSTETRGLTFEEAFAGKEGTVLVKGRFALAVLEDGSTITAFGQNTEVVTDGKPQIVATPAPAEASVSPTGDAFILSHLTSVVVMDATTLKPRWTAASRQLLGTPAWSADGTRIALPTVGGGIVLDAATGELIGQRCAGDFVATHAPPQTGTSFAQPSLCER
jgi:hypothetical protein